VAALQVSISAISLVVLPAPISNKTWRSRGVNLCDASIKQDSSIPSFIAFSNVLENIRIAVACYMSNGTVLTDRLHGLSLDGNVVIYETVIDLRSVE
jgi:hypothetical protein